MAQAGALPAAAGPVAPPQPVAVTVATARVTADLPLTFLANTRFILDNLPFLPWDVERTADGTLVRFRLGHHDAMASFVALCRFVRNPATIQALGQNDTFTLAWNGAAWSRVLTAYSAAGLFARPIANQTELLDRLGELVVPQANAGALVITHSDIFSCEPFDAPPPAAGGRGQRSGGRGAGANPAMLGPPALRFLALVELSSLCRDDQPLPLLALARLKRLLGPALTRQARGAETSQVRMAASVLRSRLEQDIFGPGDRLPDGVVAAQVPAYLRRLQLPAIFTAPSADSREILLELAEAAKYCFGRPEDCRRVENSRLHHATQLTELHRNFISASRDVEAVRYAIERLAEQFLDLPQQRQPLAQQMQVLEQCVSNHQHLLMPNNTLDQNLATLLAIAGLVPTRHTACCQTCAGARVGGRGAARS